MASALLDVVVDKLAGKVIEEISNEVSLVRNFRNDFEWLSKKLRIIRGYLRNADAQSAQNGDVKSWLLDVADIAWDAEDILVECAVQSKGTQNHEISQSSSCVCAFSYSQLVFRCKMAHRIKEVKERIRSIMKDAKELKLIGDLTHSDQHSTSTAQTVNLRGLNILESSSDSHPVAIDSKVEDVLNLMNDPAAPVIAIVGMGGLGKTFLMQNVFNRIKDKFDKAIWLAISQSFSLKKLQAALARELKLDRIDEVDELKTAELIHGCLQSTKFFVVLDDVWRATEEENLVRALGLPRGNNLGSKIVVTTRSKHVSSCLNAHHVYEPQLLSAEESWTLFSAFAFNGKQPPHHLQEIAGKVEGQCGRLPLALKTVARSLENKTLLADWESKLEELEAASSTEDRIMQILRLSYDSLPSHLKPCFVYLSFFPEDAWIDYQDLINLWVAEGYVPQGEEQLDVGWSYIFHLHSLCLLERVDDSYNKKDRRFKVHDLVLDLAVSIARKNQSAFSVEKSAISVEKGRRYRRILMGNRGIGDGDVDAMARNRAYSASCLRTLSFSGNAGITKIPAMLVNGARVMRVLDLSGTNISSLPDCAGNLKLLTLLNLRETDISKVPECVKSIKSLRFLDISKCKYLKQFPEWIGELKCLEHLDIRPYYFDRPEYMPKGISKLVSLQVLKLDFNNRICDEEENGLFKLEHFVNLLNLREVRINISKEGELKSIEDGILAVLVKMRTLTLWNKCSDEGNLSEQMLAMKDLEYLFLCNFAVPDWISQGFSNLMQLELWRCHCAEYPALEMMPNLIKLVLDENSDCKAFPKGFGKFEGFPQLRCFIIRDFPELEELPELEDGAMSRLEILEVSSCPSLKEVPRGLELLKNLKVCHFDRSHSLFEEGGELWKKMKANIPNLRIYITS